MPMLDAYIPEGALTPAAGALDGFLLLSSGHVTAA
jgi:hypothetical protein